MRTVFSRREFLELGGKFAAMFGLGTLAAPKMADALEQLASGTVPVLWLQGQSCSGCSVSLLNSTSPKPVELLTEYISLLFHSTLSTATGTLCKEIIEKTTETGGFLLAVEGSVPGVAKACMMYEKPFADIVGAAASRAKAVVAVGTCAAFGGIPAAENNPTQAMSLVAYLKQQNITTPVLSLPGCPAHPAWIVGSLAHVVRFGLPPVDAIGRPTAFYGRLLHDQCPRFADYEREKFAKDFSDQGCLFKLGCLGPKTYADCTMRFWNSGVNMCIAAGAPCVGCASELFAAKAAFPFYVNHNNLKAEEARS